MVWFAFTYVTGSAITFISFGKRSDSRVELASRTWSSWSSQSSIKAIVIASRP
jgi:hypothetical protein